MNEIGLPGILRTTLIEWRAATITDPVERLRYLRREVRARRGSLRLKTLGTAALLVSAAVLVPTVQTGTDASDEGLAARVIDNRPLPTAAMPEARSAIWKVEENGGQEVFSNGLLIENRFAAPNCPRAYSIFPGTGWSGLVPELHSDPAGIVFHTTEGEQIPFEAMRNADLRHVAQETLDHTRRNRSYHFVIDKFGRVFRIVPESDVAYHAGKSVWADDKGIYVGLNDSFLGIAFEARTLDVVDGSYLTAAQVGSGKLLVDMLIDKYHLPVSNCVTHSQVSVNPDNMKIGNHTDGAGDFPYERLGLSDNYGQPVPSVYVFGFDYDLLFLKATGFRLWKGLMLADERVRDGAITRGVSIRQYKADLRREYRRIAEAVELQHPPREKDL